MHDIQHPCSIVKNSHLILPIPVVEPTLNPPASTFVLLILPLQSHPFHIPTVEGHRCHPIFPNAPFCFCMVNKGASQSKGHVARSKNDIEVEFRKVGDARSQMMV